MTGFKKSKEILKGIPKKFKRKSQQRNHIKKKKYNHYVFENMLYTEVNVSVYERLYMLGH